MKHITTEELCDPLEDLKQLKGDLFSGHFSK